MLIRVSVVALTLACACKREESIRCGEGTVLVGNECVIRGPVPAPAAPTVAVDAAEQSAVAAPRADADNAVAFGAPVVVDGVEFTISKPFIGPLPKNKERRYSMFKVPDGDFLQFPVTLKNVSETKILVIQDVWNHTLLIDEHDNKMSAAGSGLSMNQALSDLAPHGQLRPGQRTEGLLVFEPPIDAAKTFQLESDPGIYVPKDSMLITPLSETTFKLRFSREDIQKK